MQSSVVSSITIVRAGRALRAVGTDYMQTVVAVICTLAVTPFMVNSLGSAAYGLWVVLGSVMAYLQLLELGQATALTKLIAGSAAVGDKAHINQLFAYSIRIYLLIAGIALSICFALSILLPKWLAGQPTLAPAGRFALLIIGLSIAIRLFMTSYTSILSGHQRLDIINLIQIWTTAATVIATVTFLWLNLGLIGAALGAAAGVTTGSLITLIAVHYLFPWLKAASAPASPREVLSTSVFYLLIGIGVQVIFYTDNIVIGTFLGVSSVTAYALAFQLIMISIGLVTKIGNPAFPLFVELEALGRRSEMSETFVTVSRLAVSIASLLAVGLLSFGRDFIKLWIGSDNLVTAETFFIMVTMVFMMGVINPAAAILLAAGRHKTVVIVNAAEAVLNLSLSLLLVGPYGVTGVAAGTAVATALTSLWSIPLLTIRYLNIPWTTYLFRSVVPPVLLASVIGGALIVYVHGMNRLDATGLVSMTAGSTGAALFYAAGFWYLLTPRRQRQQYTLIIQNIFSRKSKQAVTYEHDIV